MPTSSEFGSSQPYWWIAAPPHQDLDFEVPLHCDVAIVGAGYAGLSAALVLARAGRSVVVFDRDAAGEGASTRNGGITSGNVRLSYSELSRRFGASRADAVLLEAKEAREDLYRFIEDERIDCDLVISGRFAGALSVRQYDDLAREADRLRCKLGIEAFVVPQSEMHRHIGTEFYRGGNVRMDVGGLHPAKLHDGILRLAKAAGVVVAHHTAVTSVSGTAGDFKLHTARGVVKAENVISATNGYVDGLDPWLQRRIVPVRSRIIVTSVLPQDLMDQLLPTRMMISDKRHLTYYFRPTPDGKRLLFGGRDGTIEGDPSWPTEHLRHEMARIFPELGGFGIDYSWFGYVAMNRDMLPRIFRHRDVQYVTGCCGSGIVWLRWAGKKAAEAMLGQGAASALDFRPPKGVPLFRGKAWFMPAVFAAMKLQDRFLAR